MAAPASGLSGAFLLLLLLSSSCSERTFYISLTKHSLCFLLLNITQLYILEFYHLARPDGWLAELGWRLPSSKPYKKKSQPVDHNLFAVFCPLFRMWMWLTVVERSLVWTSCHWLFSWMLAPVGGRWWAVGLKRLFNRCGCCWEETCPHF